MLREHRVIRSSTAVVGSIVMMVATACASANDGGDGTSGGGSALGREPPSEGWRWESSLGVQLAVPEDWKINDTDCNQTDAPSVVRGQGSVLDCLTFEPKTKQIVEIMSDLGGDKTARPNDLSFEEVTIGSQPAERGEGETPDGRAAGWIHIPGIGAIVDVRVKDDETLQTVLDSVRVVDVDHNDCATSRTEMSPSAPKTKTLVPRAASAVSVCFYGRGDVLRASSLIEGPDAAKLVQGLNGAKAGLNPDVPENQCLRDGKEPPPDVVLIAHADGDRARVEMRYSGCIQRGFSNGRANAQLTVTLLDAIMGPIHSGYGYSRLPD